MSLRTGEKIWEETNAKVALAAPHLQSYDVSKWTDPATPFHHEGDEFCRMKEQRVGVICWRAAGIREGLPPRMKVREGRDLDLAKKIFPGAWNP